MATAHRALRYSLLSSVALLSPATAPSKRVDPAHACAPMLTWTVPEPVVTAKGERLAGLRFGNLAERGDVRVVTGIAFDQPESEKSEGRLVVSTLGSSLARAIPNHSFAAFPKIGIDSRDLVHLMWGEIAPAERTPGIRNWLNPRVTSLWTASYDRFANRWSPAQKLHDSPTVPLQWRSSDLRVSKNAALETYMLVPYPSRVARGTKPSSSIHRYRLWDGHWVTDTVKLPGIALIGSVAAAGDAAVMAYIGSASSSAPLSSVVVLRTGDDGKTWSSPEIIDSIQQNTPIEDVFVLINERSITVVWKAFPSSEGEVIRLRQFSFATQRWSERQDLITSQSTGETVASDRCGDIHFVFEGQDVTGSMHLQEAVFSSRWSTARRVFPSYKAYSAHISRAKEGLLLTFAARSEKAAHGPRNLYVSILK